MTLLVTGATGRVGRQVVHQLVQRGADVRVLVRDPSKANFPAAVNVVQGDMLDIDSLRTAFSGVRTLFLLNGVAGDEFTQALIALNLARESGIERVVYLGQQRGVVGGRSVECRRESRGRGINLRFVGSRWGDRASALCPALGNAHQKSFRTAV